MCGKANGLIDINTTWLLTVGLWLMIHGCGPTLTQMGVKLGTHRMLAHGTGPECMTGDSEFRLGGFTFIKTGLVSLVISETPTAKTLHGLPGLYSVS